MKNKQEKKKEKKNEEEMQWNTHTIDLLSKIDLFLQIFWVRQIPKWFKKNKQYSIELHPNVVERK